jgi:hypothetical protein
MAAPDAPVLAVLTAKFTNSHQFPDVGAFTAEGARNDFAAIA